MYSVAGDLILDQIINGDVTLSWGGAYNVVKGLRSLGEKAELKATVYNPLLYPLFEDSTNIIANESFFNISRRDYTNGVVQRHRKRNEDVSRSIDVEADIIVAHEMSCIRNFECFFLDVREPLDLGKGKTKYMKVSSDDYYNLVLKLQIEYEYLLVTYKDCVEIIKGGDEENKEVVSFMPVPEHSIVDTVGAGDAFTVGFMFKNDGDLYARINSGVLESQKKVCRVGVY